MPAYRHAAYMFAHLPGVCLPHLACADAFSTPFPARAARDAWRLMFRPAFLLIVAANLLDMTREQRHGGYDDLLLGRDSRIAT